MRAFELTGAREAPRELLSHHLGFVHFGSQGPFFTENKDDNQYSTNRHPAVLYRAEIHYGTASHQCMRSYRPKYWDCDTNEKVIQRCNLWEKHGASILHSFKGHFHKFVDDFHTSTFMTYCMWLSQSSWTCLESGIIHEVTDTSHAYAAAWQRYKTVSLT